MEKKSGEQSPANQGFTKYQVTVIALLAIVQFTVILDFMVMSPLGDILMKSLKIVPKQFGLVVSVYAFSAGVSGLLAAGFADKYDRKNLLLFFYTGFVLGTLLCGIAPNYHMLLFARLITGLFGGVMSSVSMAIVADLFSIHQRGRVMGFIQMSFAGSQVLGIPIGLFFATKFGWHFPFLMIVAISLVLGLAIVKLLKPVNKHLLEKHTSNAFLHLKTTISRKDYLKAFLTTGLLSIGGFLLMPFGTAYLVNNVRILQTELPVIYMVGGICTMIVLPIIGKMSDKIGKYKIFVGGSVLAMITIIIFTNLQESPLWLVVLINSLMLVGIMSRMVPSTALMSAMPELKDRGAFMSINSSLQQIAGGIASVIAGLIVVQEDGGKLLHYNILGYIGIFVMIICAILMYFINKHVAMKLKEKDLMAV
ncbi:Predicted arabinose efflux permease, MFS family [Pseudarcicella hirudinis]|uniref:Predicted arabinose efflux permease, MFS family n=1 Tax=Pseudarcicella hirudinis TaxID=1079859 RepID=A0A1I5YXK4_9BACT|nr:MFS transporter [Pseudarcicella hirudinis]SFQ48557.1 Predicted arabinose efflux permease, MFS family [Pseudarcicella hirudinis]